MRSSGAGTSGSNVRSGCGWSLRIDARRARKWTLARDHLVDHKTKRKDVASSIGHLPFDLLRRHVLQCAENRPLGGLRHRGRVAGGGFRFGLLYFGQTEIQDLHSGFREQNIGRL